MSENILTVEIKNHLLFINGKQVEFKKSPNIAKYKNKLHYLIHHYTATAGFNSPYNWLTDPVSKVSAHLMIGRDGRVVQLAPFDAVCWHAGVSEWKGVKGMNEYAIGVELVNAGILGKKGDSYVSSNGTVINDYKRLTNSRGITAAWQTYPEVQIEVTAAISQALKLHYKLKDILGHEDVSPGRKTDPGPAFPWNRIKPDDYVEKRKENFTYKQSTDRVRVRSGAGTEFSILLTIPRNTQVKVLAINGEWDNVEVNGIKGWISNQYLK